MNDEIAPKKERLQSNRKFLQLTYQILQSHATYGNIIKWSQDGKQLVILDKAEFSNNVLPHFFKHNNYTSFLRQMNSYGFKNGSSIEGRQAFYHPSFTRDGYDEELFNKKKHQQHEHQDFNHLLLVHEDLKFQIRNIQVEQQKLQLEMTKYLEFLTRVKVYYNRTLRRMLQGKIVGKTRTLKLFKIIRKFRTSFVGGGTVNQFTQEILVAIQILLREYGVTDDNFDTISEPSFQVDQSIDLFTTLMNANINRNKAREEPKSV